MGARLGLCLLFVLAIAVPAGPVAAVGPDAPGDRQATAPLTTPEDFENTLFRITVYENGSARWTIQHAQPLENGTEVEQFEAFATEFNSQDTETFQAFRTRARSLLSFARNATGRNMTARAFDRRAVVNELGQTRGVVELSFVWTAFGRSNATRVRVADVFEGGMYIAQGQRLEFRRGPALEFRDAQPTPDSMANQESLARSESVTWTGERQFSDQRPAVVFGARNASTTGGGSATGGSDTGGDGDSSATGTVPIAVAGLVIVVLVLGGLAWYRVSGPPGDGAATTESGPASGESRAGAGGSGDAPAVSEADLLSDEDRVLGLLEENGGRMKQVDIVEETEWSKSKVSMLLSEMEEADQISKLRLGRENVISVAGEEPDAAGSPFDEID
jgi:hypothetical protein